MRTERPGRSRAVGSNALATSVVIVCRPRPADAPVATRRQFLDELESELPGALELLNRESHIAPVDLAQAAIGPGMQIYSRYCRVETISGELVTVREALAAINRGIADYDERQEGDLDPETRFCLDWLKQHGFREAQYGDAEGLARAKNVSVDTLTGLDLLTAGSGMARLLPLDDYSDERRLRLRQTGMTDWEGCFRMAYHMSPVEGRGTISGAAQVARAMGGQAERAERLARILYNHFDRYGDSPNAVAFNTLVASWQGIQERVVELQTGEQGAMDLRR